MMKLLTAVLFFLLASFACHALEDPMSFFQSLEDDDKAVNQNWIEERLVIYANHTFLLPTVANPDNGIAVFWKIHTEMETDLGFSFMWQYGPHDGPALASPKQAECWEPTLPAFMPQNPMCWWMLTLWKYAFL
jgi:hypothetical protein